MGLDINKFVLRKEYFDIRSTLHGIDHTYRVMCHCLMLGEMLKKDRETILALCAAFIHDMARKHDGRCEMHGTWAAGQKLLIFRDFFYSVGVRPEELAEISTAVSNHSLPVELPSDHPFYMTTAILKDADALDRVRLSEDNLKVDYLRFSESRTLIPVSRELYYKTVRTEGLAFTDVLRLADYRKTCERLKNR